MGPIKIHNVGIYAHAQDSNAYNLSVRVKIQLNLYERCFTVLLNSCEFSSRFGFLLDLKATIEKLRNILHPCSIY